MTGLMLWHLWQRELCTCIMAIKKILVLLLAEVSLAASGQTGAFGYFIAGGNFPAGNKMQEGLRANTLLGNNFSFKPGLVCGGRGFGVFDRYLLGATVWTGFAKGNTDTAQAMLANNAGFINAGYLLLKKEKTNVYFFSGIGGTISTLEITNMGNSSLNFPGDDRPIPAGEERIVSIASYGFEAGIGITQMVIPGEDNTSKGGVMLGLVAGTYYFPARGKALNIQAANFGPISGVYIGLTIGGGIQMKNNGRLFHQLAAQHP